MLVLVSFVLVLAAAVTLVVGLLQSGLTLIYLSIACSVLAGVVLAVAVLRGRPEPKQAAPGRPYTPPQPAPVPASVGAPASGSETTSWSPPSSSPRPPPPSYSPPATPTDDSATKAAGAALLGRLRGKRGDKDAAPVAAAPTTSLGDEPVDDDVVETGTTEMPAVTITGEDDDGFPIADYDRLRATELLSRLPALDRNQLEAVREREANGKNRFTIMSRVDALLATTAEPAWEVGDDEWEDDDAGPVSDLVVSDAISVEDDEADELDDEPVTGGGAFPIAAYETLTVGQILPRLSELGADELAQVRRREEMGRGRGTILDRIDRLASRAAPAPTPMAMPPAAPARKAPARKAPARKAPVVTETSGPASKRVAKPPSRKAVAAPRKTGTVRVTPAKVAPARATKAAPAKAAPVPRKARAPKAAPPVVPATPVQEAVKKARAAAKKTKKA